MRHTGLFLVVIALLSLALPAIVSPTSLAAVIREEDALHTSFLGELAGREIALRAMRLLGTAAESGRAIGRLEPAQGDPLSERVAFAGEALTQTSYLHRLHALGRLAAFRLATLTEWLLAGLPVLVAATLDGAVMRTVKTRSFVHLSPVLFGLGLHGALATLASALVLLVLPLPIHPLVWVALLALLGVAIRTAVSNFHRIR